MRKHLTRTETFAAITKAFNARSRTADQRADFSAALAVAETQRGTRAEVDACVRLMALARAKPAPVVVESVQLAAWTLSAGEVLRAALAQLPRN
jgi:hypothetical protein